MTRYLLDANVFIEAKNRHYGFDFCPAFWEWLEDQNSAGKVASVEKVKDELYAGKDDLSAWAKSQGVGFFHGADEDVAPVLIQVSTWANGQDLSGVCNNHFFASRRLLARCPCQSP